MTSVTNDCRECKRPFAEKSPQRPSFPLAMAADGEQVRIVNIVDASNIERNLYLTTHLLEMRPPC